MDIQFATPQRVRAPQNAVSASVHRRGKHLVLYVRFSRLAVQALNLVAGSIASVGFSSDMTCMAVKWGLQPGDGWVVGDRGDGSMSCTIRVSNIATAAQLTEKFQHAGDFEMAGENTIVLRIDSTTRQG